MASKICTVTTDDLDGTPGAETVKFTVGSLQYEIDLGPANKHVAEWGRICALVVQRYDAAQQRS